VWVSFVRVMWHEISSCLEDVLKFGVVRVGMFHGTT